MPSTRSLPFVLALLGAPLSFAACHTEPIGKGRPDGGQAQSSAPLADDSVKPVYTLDGPPDVRAQRLCDLLHRVPADRRAACCKAPPGALLTQECVRVVSAAARVQAISFDEPTLERCAVETTQALDGCDWVGPWPPPLPAVCRGAVAGKLAAGARCRSSLECSGSLRCRGAGPTAPGVCGPPRAPGGACDLAVDTLATYLRADDIDRAHPECDGYCERHRCMPPLALGAACITSAQCGGGHCGGGKCTAGATAAVGAPCTGASCASGLRCVGGVCQKPGEAGAACKSDFDCAGGCLRDAVRKNASTGHCGMRCS